MMNNKTIDISKLRLKINLDHDNFDGNLNFGTVILTKNNKHFPLDVTDTIGYKHQGKYKLSCKFEADLSETKAMFELDNSFDFSQNISDLIADKKTKGSINLLLNDNQETAQHNIIQITSMALKHLTDQTVNIPIQHDPSW